ncbi:hypothetical protein COS70_02595, partial [Candidatus Micrarchaeota archaeon CG06_land_8_20_14_3_00_50_6]
KPLTNLDKFVLKFTSILERLGIRYVIISGYVPILFGRSRDTEDVDLFIEQLSAQKFSGFWEAAKNEDFRCINAYSAKQAKEDFLEYGLAIRFALHDRFIPNFEVKYPKTRLSEYSLDNRIKVIIGEHYLYTSKLELQIAFKLYLGTDKDIEDAVHLWDLFKDNLDKQTVKDFAEDLGVTHKLGKLKW